MYRSLMTSIFTVSLKHFHYFLLTFTFRVAELRGGDGTVQVSGTWL